MLQAVPLLKAGSSENPESLLSRSDNLNEMSGHETSFGVSLEEVTLKEYDGNVHPYVFQSSLLSLNWEPWRPFVILGEAVQIQLRATGVADAIFKGPESIYLGVAPQLRFIFPIGKTPVSVFAGGGGGCGWANANTANVSDGGLGEPFTFILMASWGLQYKIDTHWSVWLAMDYQHLSNAGLSDWHKQNIGLDSLGSMFGVGYNFR